MTSLFLESGIWNLGSVFKKNYKNKSIVKQKKHELEKKTRENSKQHRYGISFLILPASNYQYNNHCHPRKDIKAAMHQTYLNNNKKQVMNTL